MSVRTLLKSAFLELGTANGVVYDTQGAQAKVVDMDPGSYSRLLHKEILASKQARNIASLIWPDRPKAQEALMRALMGLDRDSGERHPRPFIEDVQAFFKRLVSEVDPSDPTTKSFLLIEYRDKPRAEPMESKYPKLAEDAAEAVAKGLSIAMVLPFRDDNDWDGPKVKAYKAEVGAMVHRVGSWIRDRADKRSGGSPVGEVRLYQPRTKEAGHFPSGIGSRMFFANYQTKEAWQSEVWEWTSGEIRDEFLKRDKAALPADVFRDQFAPIWDYWKKERRLAVKQRLASFDAATRWKPVEFRPQ